FAPESNRLKMLCGALSRGCVDCAHELRVVTKVLEHVGMLSTHGAVHDRRTRSLGHCARGSNPYRAVDNRQAGFEKVDIARGLADKVLDLERVADMQDVNALG